jgi:hypothetical protein
VALLVFSFILFLFKIIRKKNTEVKCTQTRFIGRYKKRVVDVDLNDLKEISKSQTLFEKIIHCGSLIINANYQRYKYVGIKNIDKLMAQINDLRKSNTGSSDNEVSES